jgi:hypothetical protein
VVEGLATVDKSGALPKPDPTLPRHARVVLIGDFLAPLEEIHAAVAALSGWPLRGHIVQILDPEEETLGAENRAYAGRVRFEWGSEGVLVPRVEAVRDAYLSCGPRRHRRGRRLDRPDPSYRPAAGGAAACAVAGPGASLSCGTRLRATGGSNLLGVALPFSDSLSTQC